MYNLFWIIFFLNGELIKDDHINSALQYINVCEGARLN